MTQKPTSSFNSHSDGFATGVVLGTLLGGASLFFFQTKTGQKIYDKLIEEYQSGDLDFESLRAKTNAKLEDFIKNSKMIDYVEETFTKQKAKSPSSKTPISKTAKNFFFKKGKKLG